MFLQNRLLGAVFRPTSRRQEVSEPGSSVSIVISSQVLFKMEVYYTESSIYNS
jgi:hypothetical protein